MIFVSAKTGNRIHNLMEDVMRVYEKWNTRVSTGLLNKWIFEFNKVQRMPSENGRKLKLKYLMQIKTRPPTFFIFCNRKGLVSDNFEAYLRNCISKEFGFKGVPIRLLLRDSRSQYSAKRQSGLSSSARKILERIKHYNKKKSNPTHKQRFIGSKHLYSPGFRAKRPS
jgi:predicted GTPase